MGPKSKSRKTATLNHTTLLIPMKKTKLGVPDNVMKMLPISTRKNC